MKDRKKYVLGLLLMLMAISFITSCGNKAEEPEKYQRQPIYAFLPPYTDAGSSNVDNCNHQSRNVLIKNTENGGTESIAACIKCGYSSSGYRFYYTYTDYHRDCASGGKYSGESKKIIINLDSNYNDSKFVFQSTVEEVIFVGAEGQTNNNLQIEVLSRTTPIILGFSNVRISSDKSVLVSEKCAAKVIVQSYGTSNSFATKKGADGKDGGTGYTYYGQLMAHDGKDGESAADVFVVKGDVEFIVYSPISISGGRGGNGGDGGSLNTNLPTSGGGGAGGAGGSGGDAINTNGIVTISGNKTMVDFTGGAGGKGGRGGYGRNQSSKAEDGVKGKDGKTGLE